MKRQEFSNTFPICEATEKLIRGEKLRLETHFPLTAVMVRISFWLVTKSL